MPAYSSWLEWIKISFELRVACSMNCCHLISRRHHQEVEIYLKRRFPGAHHASAFFYENSQLVILNVPPLTAFVVASPNANTGMLFKLREQLEPLVQEVEGIVPEIPCCGLLLLFYSAKCVSLLVNWLGEGFVFLTCQISFLLRSPIVQCWRKYSYFCVFVSNFFKHRSSIFYCSFKLRYEIDQNMRPLISLAEFVLNLRFLRST